MVEGARLESVYTPKAYRGFESRPVRQLFITEYPGGRGAGHDSKSR